MSEKFVECGAHGRSKPAFVCCHLAYERDVGWNEPDLYEKDKDDDFYGCINAWCDKCEVKAIATGGCNDEAEAFADIQLVCEECALRFKKASLE